MHHFDESHPAFKNFSYFYFQVIGPRLRNEEIERKAAVKTSLTRTPIIAVAVILFLTAFFHFVAISWSYNFLVICMALVVIESSAVRPFLKVSKAAKYSLVGGFCRFMNWSYFKSAPHRTGIKSCVQLGMVPACERSSFEDHVDGKANGTKFSFSRVSLHKSNIVKKDPYPWKSTYTGQFIAIELDSRFSGCMAVFPDRGFLNPKKRGGMKRVRLVDPVFERKFEVYGTDQMEARYLLTPNFMQRLVDLEHAFKGKSIRFGFVDNQLLIVIETRMRLGVGSLLRPLDEPKRMQNVLNVMGAIYDVIDSITRPQERIDVNSHLTAA